MPFPEDHFLLAFGGPLFTNEQWSMSLRSTVDTQGGGDISTVVTPAVAEAVRAWWVSTACPSGNAASLGWVKYNRIGTDGKYVVQSNSNVFEWAVPVAGVGASVYPGQIALVATLETGATRGLAHRGRIFLPAPSATMAGDGRIQAQGATDAATGVAALLEALNAVPGYGRTSVYSNVREGAQRPVTGVSVGRVLDTMRSRRTSQEEERPAVVPVGGT